jgi:alpha-ketoglutarate-dependent taurine dioxygenase
MATHPVLHVKGRIGHDLIGLEFGAAFLEFVGDELEEEQSEDEVLVFRRFHTAPQQVRGIPKGLFETLLGLLGAAFFFAILVPVADSGWECEIFVFLLRPARNDTKIWLVRVHEFPV